MENKATCVHPSPEKTPEVTYVGEEQEVWLSEVEGGVKVCYLSIYFLIIFDINYIILCKSFKIYISI